MNPELQKAVSRFHSMDWLRESVKDSLRKYPRVFTQQEIDEANEMKQKLAGAEDHDCGTAQGDACTVCSARQENQEMLDRIERGKADQVDMQIDDWKLGR
jgi:hypothetical protein